MSSNLKGNPIRVKLKKNWNQKHSDEIIPQGAVRPKMVTRGVVIKVYPPLPPTHSPTYSAQMLRIVNLCVFRMGDEEI